MTARAEVYVRSASIYSRRITIQCYDFDFIWTFNLDTDNQLSTMVSCVRQKLIACARNVATFTETQNDIYLVRAWIEIENAFEASCPFHVNSASFENADNNSLMYDWLWVGLESVPPPGQSLSQTLQNLSNYIFTTIFESPIVTRLAIKNLILPICNSLWLFLDILQRFWTRTTYADELNLATREIKNPRPLTDLAIAGMQNPILGTSLLLPDVLNL